MWERRGADALHQSTKHGTPPARPERLVQYHRLDPRNAPLPFKEYRALSASPLPRRIVPSSLPAVAVLSGARGESVSLDVELMATLLFLAGGVNRVAAREGRVTAWFRSAMSAGNLHPVEVYVVTGPAVEGVPAGVHHFGPRDFALTGLRSGDLREHLGVSSPAALVLTGLVWRTTWKYGERGWRHLYWDAGTMVANLLAAAEAHGLEVQVLAGFDDGAVARLVGVDGVDEVPLAVITLGESDDAALEPEAGLRPLSTKVTPVAPRPIRLPLLVEAQRDGALRADEVESWRREAAAVGEFARSRVDPPSPEPEDPIEDVILRRGSTRAMRRRPVPSKALQWAIGAATRAVPLDAAAGGTLLEHFVNVHAVAGLASGAYRWAGGDMDLIRHYESLRDVSARLCLDQALGGDSAYTVFHAARLDPILDRLGARGYRAAQLEAGIVSGRLALCAFALGLGATGLTFFDDPVGQFFETEAEPMLVTSVGVPVAGPAPWGAPGGPAVLPG